MEKLKVSILVPIYKTSEYIERCARSLFAQTYNNIEYVFVNDCTPDDSLVKLEAVLSQYYDRKKQVRIISHKENQGLAISRNSAVQAATGDYLFHVDSDDFIPKNAIQQLVNEAKQSGADIVYGTCEGIFGNQRIKFPQKETKNVSDYLWNVLTRRCMVNIWGKLIRRSLYSIDLLLKKDDSFGEDYLTLPKLIARSESVHFLDNTIYYYTINRSGAYSDCFDRIRMSRIKECEEELLAWFDRHSVSFNFNYRLAFSLGSFYNKAGMIEHANFIDYPYIEKIYPSKVPFSLFRLISIKHLIVLLLFELHLWKMINMIIQFKAKNR